MCVRCVTRADTNESEANRLLERTQQNEAYPKYRQAFCRLPDVCRRQRLQLSGEEELSVSQLVLLFLWEIHYFMVLHLLFNFS